MTWFKVDDSLHSHFKAMTTSLAALGLWAVAGSWSSDHLTDGFVPDRAVGALSRGQSELADELVAAELWKRVRGGYQFHEWHENGDGAKRNPTRAEIHEQRRRKAEAGRKGGLASGQSRSTRLSKSEASAEADAKQVLDDSLNPRPDPTIKNTPPTPQGGRNGSRRSSNYAYDSDPDFLRFWDAYPLKKAKPKAFQAWKAARKRGVAPEVIIDATTRYRDSPERKPDYTAHPATWLNGERYNDFDEVTSSGITDWWDA